ncbi:MAG TPA: DNA-3-methyladenine glycosylase I [Phycisphaerae bacterium]|nr:DNA-3-methyladenine glycosylase I [Phycisphaerae bacterium]HRW52382.1 DNA-3-methyladenine glycosylase I [Phycisphaerae bacterium]
MAVRKVDPGDGKPRCAWAAKDELQATYHDREWGRPIRTDAGHLRRMAQEIFQCGLSWRIVLVKTPALKEAFLDFDVDRVARMKPKDVDRLMANDRIIRNRRKIEATVHNAIVFRDIASEHGGYCKWFNKLPSSSAKEIAALYPLFRKTFKFMGPETTKCYLMGVGKIPQAHEPGCWLAS